MRALAGLLLLLAAVVCVLIIGELRREFFGTGGHVAPLLWLLPAAHSPFLAPRASAPASTAPAAVPDAPAVSKSPKEPVLLLLSPLSLPEQAAAHGALPLTPGDPRWRKCWFHSQIPHYQDLTLFEQLGGQTKDCAGLPARTAPQTSSEAQLCDCLAPPDASAFNQSFLEIGANDGVALSNLLFFELQMGWAGLCIEGSPIIFSLLIRNRPRCHNLNRIISASAAPQTFFTHENPSGSWESTISCVLGSFSCPTRASAVEAWEKSYPGTVFHEDLVQGAKLSAIFAELRWHNFGWISVDVEGAEASVFETIDWTKTWSRFVSYEGRDPEVEAILTAAGYDPLAGLLGADHLYVPGPAAHPVRGGDGLAFAVRPVLPAR